MQHFADRLFEAVERKKSCVVVGLDARPDRLPEPLKSRAARSEDAAAEALLEFNLEVIAATAPCVAAVKPQSAFYEALGWRGIRALQETLRAAREAGLLTILDAKRGDIGTTAEAYAEACLDRMQADAVTVNPYLGTDSIAPFVTRAAQGHGVLVLVKTSNPSSKEIQDLRTGESTIYEKVAELTRRWGEAHTGRRGYSAVGAVVGATYPREVERLRGLMPSSVFLLPGYGAQGGTAEDCRAAFDAQGLGAVVNSSRGIIYAFEKAAGPWTDAVAAAARRTRDDLERVRVR